MNVKDSFGRFLNRIFKRIKFGVFSICASDICCIHLPTYANPKFFRVYTQDGIIHYLPRDVFEKGLHKKGCLKNG